MGISIGFHMSFHVKLFLIVTYLIYLCLITFAFVKINCRIKQILSKNNLICILHHHYNTFTVIEGFYSFMALFLLTLIPLLHLTGYFFVFVILTEYTEVKLLTIIINKEVAEFKTEADKIKATNLYAAFIKNNFYKGFDNKVNSICNYFSHDFANNNLFIFYKFLALKNSFHDFYESMSENATNIDESILLDHYKESIIHLEREINLTCTLIKKYEFHFAN